MMSSERTEDWKSEAINQLQKVVDGLSEITRTANSIEEVNAALDERDTSAFFDERTRRFDIKYDEEFDTQEERNNLEKAISIVEEIFGCVKGTVQDTWIMQKEEEERAKQARFNRSRRAFEPTSLERGFANELIQLKWKLREQDLGLGCMRLGTHTGHPHTTKKLIRE
jgi:hypothetical protein